VAADKITPAKGRC